MQIARRAMLLGVAALAGCARTSVTLHIASQGDELAFQPNRLNCAAGAAVTLIFHHAGQIVHDPHDWILLKPGTRKNFLAIADRAPDGSDGVTAQNREMILARTPLCPLGATVQTTFTAPQSAGNYDFVCSIPGHGETMNGILTVT